MKCTSLGCFLVIITILLEGCGENTTTTSPQDIAKDAYQWEKAKFDRDYNKQQKLIYKKGTYEAYKNDKKIDSGLKDKDIRYEIYQDKKDGRYLVFADFKNPNGVNMVKDNVVLRKEGEMWKVDVPASLNTIRDEVAKEYKEIDCIHCK